MSSASRYLKLSPAEQIMRAKLMAGRKDIGYSMTPGKNGGRDPNAKDPCSVGTRTADCVGFALWAMGLDRYQPDFVCGSYEGWINTNSMMLDALGLRSFFTPMVELVYPHLLVYPSASKKLLAQGYPRVGHVGVVVEIDRAVHCSAGNARRLGHAIDYGPEKIWSKHPRCMRLVLSER